MDEKYRTCTQCIMDTSDPNIIFDENGVCNHCHEYKDLINSKNYLNKKQPNSLEKIVNKIKMAGKGKKYDCLIGVSGGVDSTYTAYIVKELGLRPLAIHLDNGWDSELAVDNIEKTLKKLNINLHTYVLDWEEFKDLQLSFLKASTPDLEIPTDHALIAIHYKAAVNNGLKYIISGHNVATESGGSAAWSQGHGDWLYIKGIQKKFGTKKLKTFFHYGPWRFFYYALIKKLKWIPILDYLDYNKKNVTEILQKKLGWRYYGGKHYKSVYTRFYQGYILPKKFGFNKRKAHLSSLIWSGQMSRQEALAELAKNDYPDELQQADKEYVIKKLGISTEEFERIMTLPSKTFWNYLSYKKILSKFRLLMAIYRKIRIHQ